jgi:hypothetical protein
MRRFKLLYINVHQLLSLFNSPNIDDVGEHLVLNRWMLPNLPHDYEVRAVHYDPRYQSFGLVIWSSEYPEIPNYKELEVLEMEVIPYLISLKMEKENVNPEAS